MEVAKLSDGKIVRVLSEPRTVKFTTGKHVLVADKLTMRMRQIVPYWVPETSIAWVMSFQMEG